MRDADWQIGPVETIPMLERPDTEFRKLALTDSGLRMIDDLGIAEGLGRIGAAVLCYDRAGELMAERGLRHGGQLFDAYDLYWWSTSRLAYTWGNLSGAKCFQSRSCGVC